MLVPTVIRESVPRVVLKLADTSVGEQTRRKCKMTLESLSVEHFCNQTDLMKKIYP